VLVLLLLVVAISPASNGQERTGVSGISRPVLLLLVVDISPASNGQEIMGVHGTKRYFMQPKDPAIQMSLTMSFSKGVQDETNKESISQTV